MEVVLNNLEFNVPMNFLITKEYCDKYFSKDENFEDELSLFLRKNINIIENKTNKNFMKKDNPLLLSINLNSEFIILNESVLNLGLTEEIINYLEQKVSNPNYFFECYLTFIKNYSIIVDEIDKEKFINIENKYKGDNKQLTLTELKLLVEDFKKIYKDHTKRDFIDNPEVQLLNIIKKYFELSRTKEANIYKQDLNLPDNLGIYIVIQEMILGNFNEKSAVGVMHTRDEMTGDNKIVGNFVINSQECQAIISYLDRYNQNYDCNNFEKLKDSFESAYVALKKIAEILEIYYKDALEINFVIENNKLYITQISNLKRSINAAMTIYCDLSEEQKSNQNEIYIDEVSDFVVNNKNLIKIKKIR